MDANGTDKTLVERWHHVRLFRRTGKNHKEDRGFGEAIGDS